MSRPEDKRISLGPNRRQSVTAIEQSMINEQSLMQAVQESNTRKSLTRKSLTRKSLTRQSVLRPSLTAKKVLSKEEIQKMYAECHLLCDQGKVTENNVWTLKFIDYINECIEDDDNSNHGSANFIKAGLAINAGVQIYSVKVDAVHKQTFAVMDSIRQAETVDDGNEDMSSFETQTEKPKEDEFEKPKPKRAKKNNNAKPTLEKNPNNLINKMEKQEYTIDRLFHQRISAVEGKSIMQDVVHNYGGFISGDYKEVIDIEDEGTEWSDVEIDFDDTQISNLGISEITNDKQTMLVQSIVDELKTPAASQSTLENEQKAQDIIDNLPAEPEQLYMDDMNPVDDNGTEILPNVQTRNPLIEELAPHLGNRGFSYFDPNLYNIKEIAANIRKEVKEGKHIQKEVKEKKEKQPKQDMYDLRGKKIESYDKLFDKKPTTAEIKKFDKLKTLGEVFDINEFNTLMLVPEKKLTGLNGDGDVMTLFDRKDTLSGIGKSILKSTGIVAPALGPKASMLKQQDEEGEDDERMIIRSDDEEVKVEDEKKNHAFVNVEMPRTINFEKIAAATKPKNLDYDGAEALIIKTIDLWKEKHPDDNQIEFQEILDGIKQVASETQLKDLSVHFIFVSVAILCFRKGYFLQNNEDGKMILKLIK